MIERPLPADYRAALARDVARLGPFAADWHFFDSVTSTNDVAALLTPSPGVAPVVVSESQTAGRGRRGRSWFSAAGAGLYASVLLPRGSVPDQARASQLTLTVAIALAESLDTSTGVVAAIKWPNDLMVHGRKLAGILVEARSAGEIDQIVVGFGINVRLHPYPDDLSDRVTSIEAEGGRTARADILVEALASIARGVADLGAGRFDAILTRWRRRSPTSEGAGVEWLAADGPRRGTTAGVDETGALLIRAGADVERVVAGDVRWL